MCLTDCEAHFQWGTATVRDRRRPHAARIGDQLSPLEAISASIATIGNIGPGFGSLGPFGGYLGLSDASKLLMHFLRWIGRLEIVPALFVSGIDQR